MAINHVGLVRAKEGTEKERKKAVQKEKRQGCESIPGGRDEGILANILKKMEETATKRSKKQGIRNLTGNTVRGRKRNGGQ